MALKQINKDHKPRGRKPSVVGGTEPNMETPQTPNPDVQEFQNPDGTTFVKQNQPTKESSQQEDLKELFLKQQESFQKMLNQQAEQIELLKKQIAEGKIQTIEGTNKEAVPADDWMEEPVLFFSLHYRTSVYGYTKKNIEHLHPYGKTVFRPLKRRMAANEKTLSISVAKVHSKKELEHLRNHTDYKITFFEEADQMSGVDYNEVISLSNAQRDVSVMSDMQVIEQCNNRGITIGKDIDKMRHTLIMAIAKSNKFKSESFNPLTVSSPEYSVTTEAGKNVMRLPEMT